MDEIEQEAINRLLVVLTEPQRSPAYHRAKLSRLRRQWPALWQALEHFIAVQTAHREAQP